MKRPQASLDAGYLAHIQGTSSVTFAQPRCEAVQSCSLWWPPSGLETRRYAALLTIRADLEIAGINPPSPSGVLAQALACASTSRRRRAAEGFEQIGDGNAKTATIARGGGPPPPVE